MQAIEQCRACDSKELIEFLSLGKQYLSDFRDDDKKPPKYPLDVVICDGCKLVQLKHSTPQAEMYHQNYGFKSSINEKIREDLEDVTVHAFQYVNDPKRWLDIASNDGTLLSFVPKDVHRVGVDPVEFLCKQAEEHADQIINDYFEDLIFREQFDVITSISCFYDMPKPRKFVEDVTWNLAPKGVWIIQQNYLLATLQQGAVDNFCHEHLEYYTLLSLEPLLEAYGLEVNEVTTSSMNGGSFRTIVSHKGTFPIDQSVHNQRELERLCKLDDLFTYEDFAIDVQRSIKGLKDLVFEITEGGKTVCILGASTRGATIWQMAGFGSHNIQYVVERNPAKVDRMFSSIGVRIISEAGFHKHPTDYAIIGPWFFADAIMEREKDYRGTFIIPLPNLRTIEVRT